MVNHRLLQVLEESKVICEFLTVQGVGAVFPTLFKGQLYFSLAAFKILSLTFAILIMSYCGFGIIFTNISMESSFKTQNCNQHVKWKIHSMSLKAEKEKTGISEPEEKSIEIIQSEELKGK